MESEAFIIGLWPNFATMEDAISMPELQAILEASRLQSYEDKKFYAAMQGVDLEAQAGQARFDAIMSEVSGSGELDFLSEGFDVEDLTGGVLP